MGKFYFPVGKFPTNVLVQSLFEVEGNPNVKYGFESNLPDNYFFKNIPADKKVLLIADQDRIGYISRCLNGFRDEFPSNVSIWPIADKSKRFELLAQYMNGYISQESYDLIIADCDLYNEKYFQASRIYSDVASRISGFSSYLFFCGSNCNDIVC